MISPPQFGTPEAEKATGLRHKHAIESGPEAPLVLLVHGRAGNADVMWSFRRCIPEGANILAPQAPLPDSVGGYSWWKIEGRSLEKDGAEIKKDILSAAELLQNFINQAVSHYQLRPSKLVGLGFSQGAGLLSALAQSSPEQLNAVGLLAGFVVRIDRIAGGVAPQIFIAHGTEDEVVPCSEILEGRRYLEERGYRVEFASDPVGHKVGTQGMRALKHWLAAQLG